MKPEKDQRMQRRKKVESATCKEVKNLCERVENSLISKWKIKDLLARLVYLTAAQKKQHTIFLTSCAEPLATCDTFKNFVEDDSMWLHNSGRVEKSRKNYAGKCHKYSADSCTCSCTRIRTDTQIQRYFFGLQIDFNAPWRIHGTLDSSPEKYLTHSCFDFFFNEFMQLPLMWHMRCRCRLSIAGSI